MSVTNTISDFSVVLLNLHTADEFSVYIIQLAFVQYTYHYTIMSDV